MGITDMVVRTFLLNFPPYFLSRDHWHLRQDVVVSHSRGPIFLECLEPPVTDSYCVDIGFCVFSAWRVHVDHLESKK